MSRLANSNSFFFCSALVLLLGYWTIVVGYSTPNQLSWDESYYIPAAQKYLDGIPFVEGHPPLGKLFIAAGEWLVGANKMQRVPLFPDHITTLPYGYSLRGFRLLPTIFTWLSALVFYCLLAKLLANSWLALIFSSLFIFDNAIIAHCRLAVLEGPLLFYVLCSLLHLAGVFESEKPVRVSDYAILGALIGCAISIKINALILLGLIVLLILVDSRRSANLKFLSCAQRTIAAVAGIVSVFIFSWYLHFALISPEKSAMKAETSQSYQFGSSPESLSSINNFFAAIRSSLAFSVHETRKVAALTESNQDHGSHPFFWPFGRKSSSYAWSSDAQGQLKALHPQCNPIVWFASIVGTLLALVLVLSHFIFGLPQPNSALFFQLASYSFLYLGYMLAVLTVRRVLYLHNYFIPLMFSHVLLCLMVRYFFEDFLKRRDAVTVCSLLLFLGNVFFAFWYFSPLTYFTPLSYEEFLGRQWFDIWDLKLPYWQ